MKKLIVLALVLVLAVSFSACGANLSDEKVVENAQTAEVEGHPGVVFATALADAFEVMNQDLKDSEAGYSAARTDWSYGWVSENKIIEPSLDANERPVHCSVSLTTDEFNVFFINFIYDTEDNILVPASGELPDDAGSPIALSKDEAAAYIADLFSIFELSSASAGGDSGEMSGSVSNGSDTPSADTESQTESQDAVGVENATSLTGADVEAFFKESFPDALEIDSRIGQWPLDGKSNQLDGYFVRVLHEDMSTSDFIVTLDGQIYDATDLSRPQLIE